MKKKVNLKKIINLWLPPLLWMGVIFFFSSRPMPKTTRFYWPDFIIKKTAHFVEYAILATFYFRGFLVSGIPKKKAGFLAVFLSFLYGFSDEFHQIFTPGREPRLRDVLIDTLGAATAIYCLFSVLPKSKFKFKDRLEKFLGF